MIRIFTFILVLTKSFSSADKATIGLIVDPGEYSPDIVLFNSGFKLSFCNSFHFFSSMPYKKIFGSNDGEEFIAKISPVKMSITQMDPALSLRSSVV